MKITFLGTGTSDGVPMIGCKCEVCRSRNKKNKRLRSSILITHKDKNYLIDTSIDFREQMLRENINHIENIFYTHSHADHTYGIVDIRAINWAMNNKTIDCYGNKETMDDLSKRYDFIFNPIQRGGGLPSIKFKIIDKPMQIDGLTIIPINILHGILPILGYRFNNFAYITDASKIEKSSLDIIKDVDVLVINTLRYRDHSTHFGAQTAVDIIQSLNVKRTYLTHMTHDINHNKFLHELPKNIKPAFDGLKIYI